MSEKKLWNIMKQNVRHRCHIQRIETRVNQGVPDVEGCYKGINFWAEFKYLAKRPKRSALVPKDINAYQTAWLSKRRDNGGNAWVVFQVGDELFILDGKYSTEVLTLKKSGIAYSNSFWENKSGVWLKKRPWDWDIILNTLTGL